MTCDLCRDNSNNNEPFEIACSLYLNCIWSKLENGRGSVIEMLNFFRVNRQIKSCTALHACVY